MIILDAEQLRNPEAAHTYLKDALGFPEYYGKNLDALYDCLTDLGDTDIRFIHTENAELYFQSLMLVFQDAANSNPRLHIWEEADEE